ncbi:MFS transporter [Roseospira marina]|uniref:MFS transporter n=1 Tax=Roseospira marina TaxID=140057 RepID=A0A5M6I9N2_9PROT|nr:MFS transporter [Roseospira marina]KAA5604872.1 MFS transporter [Roseospira marina]MBB4315208.1 MFS family permease [Roseospira marina]MBB5088208.1 MFS family permease [Roseospira marina]
MWLSFRSVAALLVSVGIMFLGQGLLNTLLGVNLAARDLPSTISGLVMSGYFLGLVLGSILAIHVIHRVGHIRAFAALASTFSAAALAHAFFSDPIFWGVLRVIAGFCCAGLLMCTESWLNEVSTRETRGTVLSMYMIATYLSQGIAQFLLGVGQTGGYVLYALVSILLSMALVPVALTKVKGPALPTPRRFGFRTLVSISPTGVIGCLSSGVALGAFYGVGPLFARQIGLDLSGTAAFMSAIILGGLILQWPLGWISDRFDRRPVIIVVALCLSAVCAGLAGLGLANLDLNAFGPTIALLTLAALFGALASTLYPLSAALANDWIDPEDMVPASGGLLLAYSIGAVIGPIVGSVIMDLMGPHGLFAMIVVVGIVLAAFTFVRMQMRESVPMEEQAPMQVMPRMTAMAYELIPTEDENGQLCFNFDAPPEPANETDDGGDETAAGEAA